METWIFVAAGGVFLISILAYVCLMVFLPEWVGITGKVALENEASHRADSPESREINKAEGIISLSDSPEDADRNKQN